MVGEPNCTTEERRAGSTFFRRACFAEVALSYCAPAALAFFEDVAALASLIPA
jgi:hypothetical protein